MIERWESALRVRSAIIAQKLIDLTIAERELRRGEWPASMFASASDVSAYVSRAVGHANAAYHSERGRCAGIQALHAVVEAEAAIDEIGRDPAVVAFLAWGTGVGLEPFRSACRMLVALLDVLPTTASPVLLNVDNRTHATAAGSGRWGWSCGAATGGSAMSESSMSGLGGAPLSQAFQGDGFVSGLASCAVHAPTPRERTGIATGQQDGVGVGLPFIRDLDIPRNTTTARTGDAS